MRFNLNLDSTGINFVDQIPAIQVQVRLVAIEPGCAITMEPVYLQCVMGLDRQPI